MMDMTYSLWTDVENFQSIFKWNWDEYFAIRDTLGEIRGVKKNPVRSKTITESET